MIAPAAGTREDGRDASRSARGHVAVLRDRLRTAGPRAALRMLAPRRVNELLYAVGPDDELPEPHCVVDVQVARYDAQTPSGNPAIDRRLGDARSCYVAQVDGRDAHRSWLHANALLPSLFGFPAAPVIGDCTTSPGFRGLHLYPYVLAHVVADLRARRIADTVHVLVAPDNSPSIRGIERAGFRFRAHLHGLRVATFVLRLPTRGGRRASAAR